MGLTNEVDRAVYGPMFEENARLKAALEEHETVIDTMLTEDWPIPRLGARLTRLREIARRALSPAPQEGEAV